MRLELRDGQWAVLRERITHAEDKRLKRVYRAGKDDPEVAFDIDTVLVRVYVTAWEVRDLDGALIPLGDENAQDRAPDDIINDLSVAAAELWAGVSIPQAPTPNSSDA